MIQASRWSHIPVAVANGRRNGTRTRRAESPATGNRLQGRAQGRGIAVHSGIPARARPIANRTENTSASRAVPLRTRFSSRGSTNRRTFLSSGIASGNGEQGQAHGQLPGLGRLRPRDWRSMSAGTA